MRRRPRSRDIPTRGRPDDRGPQAERWGALATFLLATFYLWLLGWLLAWVAVPVIGLGFEPVVVTGGSMSPMIRAGDVVLLAEVPDEVQPGSVVTFEDPAHGGRLTTHRVSSINEDGSYQTRGDANLQPDSTPVPADALVGVGRLLVPFVGLPVSWLQSNVLSFVGWLIATVIACAVALRSPDRRDDPGDDADDASVSGPGPVAAPVRWRARLSLPLRTLATRWTKPRPRAGPIRVHGPLAVATSALAWTWRLGSARMVGVVLLAAVVLLDPRGPELRVGQWLRTWRRLWCSARKVAVDHAPFRLPAPARPAIAVAMICVSVVGVVHRSTAAFSAATDSTGSSFEVAVAPVSFVGASSNSTLDLTLSLSRPAGVQAGDVLVAAIDVEDGTSQLISPPSGWNVITSVDSTRFGMRTYWHLATSSEPSSYSWGLIAHKKVSGVVAAYRNVDSTNPIDVSGTASGTAGAMTAPSVTTTSASGRLITAFGSWSGDAAHLVPTGMTRLASVTPDWQVKTSAADQELAGAGATGTRSAGDSASDLWVAQAIALRRAS